jgi:hypothetical protein
MESRRLARQLHHPKSILSPHGETSMSRAIQSRAGKVKYALLGWLIGLPLPIILILLFFRGCDF